VLKPSPGVYRMLDARGDVLYVGKARALKARVANYTQPSQALQPLAPHDQPDAVDGPSSPPITRPRRCCSKRS
jgi:hypothetical protein